MLLTWSGESRWADIHTFRYCGLRFDGALGVAEFDYVHEGSEQQLGFTETIAFPLPEEGIDVGNLQAFLRVLELLYVAVGTVYYKAIAPREVAIDAVALAPAARRWAQQLYWSGLAEFAYSWDLEHVLQVPLRIRERAPVAEQIDVGSSSREPLVAVSGGKDSIVALEVLRSAGLTPSTFSVGREPYVELAAMADKSPGPFLGVRRLKDPQLEPMTRAGALRSGHVPVTAINGLVGTALAALHGLGPAVFANERSADEQNVVWRGHEVNHQWAKSAAAEKALAEALGEHVGIVSGSFSLLRGMSELTICRWFASITGYDELLRSCNVAVRPDFPDPTQRWCHQCDKCRWVFLALAPFMTRARLMTIFGRDMLADPTQLPGYRELVGLVGNRPFDCVGGTTEARVAVASLAASPHWQDAVVIHDVAAQMPAVPAASEEEVWRVDAASSVPAAYQAALDQWSPTGSPAPHGGS